MYFTLTVIDPLASFNTIYYHIGKKHFHNRQAFKKRGTDRVIPKDLCHNSLTMLTVYARTRRLFPSYRLLMPINFFRD
jgi:hypothetical protein